MARHIESLLITGLASIKKGKPRPATNDYDAWIASDNDLQYKFFDWRPLLYEEGNLEFST